MNTREKILQRVRNAVAEHRVDGWQEQLEDRMHYVPEMVRPAVVANLLGSFIERLEKVGGSCDCLDAESQVPHAVLEYVNGNGLPQELRLAPGLEDIAWGNELRVSYGNTRGDDLVSVTPALCAVAETGSVVLVSGPDSPTTLNFLPDIHIVIVHENQLVAQYEDVWAKLRNLDAMPRAVNFITGPSRTADIEQRIQIGAHGPRNLHVLIVRTTAAR